MSDSSRMMRLKTETRAIARNRGHDIGCFTTITPSHAVAFCVKSDCNARVDVRVGSWKADDAAVGVMMDGDCRGEEYAGFLPPEEGNPFEEEEEEETTS